MPPVGLMQGTLDLLLLKALSWGPMHGYDVNRWLRQTTGQALTVEEGALYPALHRLEARGWVQSEWGLTEQNRRAKYYRLTRAGRDQCRREASAWERYAGVMARVIAAGRT
jgi:transcriptional regulator